MPPTLPSITRASPRLPTNSHLPTSPASTIYSQASAAFPTSSPPPAIAPAATTASSHASSSASSSSTLPPAQNILLFTESQGPVPAPASPLSPSQSQKTPLYRNCDMASFTKIDRNHFFGKGASSAVYLACIQLENGWYPCAGKLTHREGHDAEQEMKIFGMLTHFDLSTEQTRVLRAIGVSGPRSHRIQYFPICTPTLHTCLSTIQALKMSDPKLYDAIRYDIFNSTRLVLEHFHEPSRPIVYRDLKSSNLGLYRVPGRQEFKRYVWCAYDCDSAAQYADFAHCRNPVGTVRYMAPETGSIQDFPFDMSPQDTLRLYAVAADSWPLGQLLRELSGEEPLYSEGEGNAVLFKKSALYINYRKQHPSSTVTRQVYDSYQQEIRDNIRGCHRFEAAWGVIKAALSEDAPEKRPSLQTLKYADDKLSSFCEGRPPMVDSFYHLLRQCFGMQIKPRMPQASKSSPTTTGSEGGRPLPRFFPKPPPASGSRSGILTSVTFSLNGP